jgi:hypothetical protein
MATGDGSSRPSSSVRLQADVDFSPGTLGVALKAEADGSGHVEFRDGEPVWCAGPARFAAPEVLP